MKFESKFNIGQAVFIAEFANSAAYRTQTLTVAGPFTIGQIRITHTDSLGIEQDGIQFDNYKAQQSYVEEYMFVETGIGSGTIYNSDKVFATMGEAQHFIDAGGE